MSSQLQPPNRPRPPQPTSESDAPPASKPKAEAAPRRPSRSDGKRPARKGGKSAAKAPSAPEAVLSYEDYKAGDAVKLPFSGKTVALTHFYTTPSGTWYAAYDKGCVRVTAIAARL